MTKATFILILMLISLHLIGSQIGIGLFSEDIVVWRYWESNNGTYSQKLLVLNVSDSDLEFGLEEIVVVGYRMKIDTSQTRVVIHNTKIEFLNYLIFDLGNEDNTDHSSNDKDILFRLFVNEEKIGILGKEFIKPPKELLSYKYVSYTGLNGSTGKFWIAKNRLFSSENTYDSILLQYRFIRNPIAREKELYWIRFQPTNNVNSFVITTNGIQKGNYDHYNFYEIEVPYSSETNSTTTSQIMVNYKANKNSTLFLGITCRYGININDDDDSVDEYEKRAMNGIMTLPMLVK